MNELQVAESIAQALDSLVALGIAVWVINIGLKRLDTMQAQYQGFVNTVLKQQQENNEQLMHLVSTLCLPPDAKIIPK